MHFFNRVHQLEPKHQVENTLRPPQRMTRRTLHDRTNVFWGVEGFPRRAVGLLPFRIGHLGMMHDAMMAVIFVQIDVHPPALLPQDLVVLGAGQWSEAIEIEDVDW